MTPKARFFAFFASVLISAGLLASCYPFNLPLFGDSGFPGLRLVGDYTGTFTITYKDGTFAGPFSPGDSIPVTGKIIKAVTPDSKPSILIGRFDKGDIKLNIQSNGSLAFRPPVGGFTPIGSYDEFQLINTDTATLGRKYRQEADIDLMDVEWTPIGRFSPYFSGIFDGNNKNLDNLKITQSGSSIGLFGIVDGNSGDGIVEKVHIRSGIVTGGGNTGGIVGDLGGGGVVNLCSNGATITIAPGSSDGVGGLVGSNRDSAIINCYNTGPIIAVDNTVGTGGIVGIIFDTGSSSTEVIACYNTGSVRGKLSVGGITGTSQSATVIACYNSGEVSGEDAGSPVSNIGVGGIVGWYLAGGGEITACYNRGSVTMLTDAGPLGPDYFGGIVGYESSSAGTISANYWLDTVGVAVLGIGRIDTGIGNDFNALPFSAPPDWPNTSADPQWGKGNGSGDGQYWKSLGSLNSANPAKSDFPKLWFE